MGEKPSLSRHIARVAAQQHGNITRGRLLTLGVGPDAIDYWVGNGRLHRDHRGVYAVGRPPATPLEKAAAAALACGERAALSHGSAMTLWGFWKRWDEPFDVTVGGDRRPAGIRTHRTTRLLRRDVKVHEGIRVTSPARTLLDMAPEIQGNWLTRAVNDGRRSGLITLDALADVLERFPFHPGVLPLWPHLGVERGPTRSELEDAFLEFCKRFDLPVPKINATVGGYEVDAYFERVRLIVELDGWDFHSNRRSFESDRERDAAMLALGIATIRVTWRRMMDQPEREAERLRAILQQRRRAAA